MSPFETLPEHIVATIISYLNNWQEAHAAFLCTSRAARFGNETRGFGARMALMRFFSAYIFGMKHHKERHLHRIIFDVLRYGIPGPMTVRMQLYYGEPVEYPLYHDWHTIIALLRIQYRNQCQHLIAANVIPEFLPGPTVDALRSVLQFRHMYENEAITQFQLCVALHQLFIHCEEEANVAVDMSGAAFGILNLCAGDDALAAWISPNTQLINNIRAFTGGAFQRHAMYIALPHTMSILGIPGTPYSLPHYQAAIAYFQDRRPGCACCQHYQQSCAAIERMKNLS